MLIFLLLNFCVSFLSDLFLNKFDVVPSLHTYFYNQSSLKTAFDAGLTVVVALLINMVLSHIVFGFSVPTNLKTLFYFCVLAFLVGYVIDILIYKFKVFEDRLNEYYKTLGAGLWGSLAFLFSIVISYFLEKYIKHVWIKWQK